MWQSPVLLIALIITTTTTVIVAVHLYKTIEGKTMRYLSSVAVKPPILVTGLRQLRNYAYAQKFVKYVKLNP